MLLKGLPNPLRPNKTYISEKSFLNVSGILWVQMSHGFTWGLVLLKDLPKPPIPVGIFIPKSKWKIEQYLRQRNK